MVTLLKQDDLFSLHPVDQTRVRYDYLTALGEPPPRLVLNGGWYRRAGFHPLDDDPVRGVAWYELETTLGEVP